MPAFQEQPVDIQTVPAHIFLVEIYTVNILYRIPEPFYDLRIDLDMIDLAFPGRRAQIRIEKDQTVLCLLDGLDAGAQALVFETGKADRLIVFKQLRRLRVRLVDMSARAVFHMQEPAP